MQRRAGLPVARGERRLPLPALPQAPLSEDLIERALQHLDFRSGDLLRSACLGKNRSLVHDVHEVLDLIRRCTCSGCVAGLLQGHLGAVQLSRRQRTHARRAARALHRRIRLLQCRMPGRGGAAGRERGDEEKRRGGAQPQRAPVQDTHRRAPDSGTVAASREPAGLLLHLLAQLARDRLCLRRLRLDLGKLGVHRRLFRQVRARARAPSRGPRLAPPATCPRRAPARPAHDRSAPAARARAMVSSAALSASSGTGA